MKVTTALALTGIALLGFGAALNADLVATRLPVATGHGTVSAPVILILILFAAGSWFLFLLITSVSQGALVQKIERLSTALVEKDREVLQLKATFFDESAETLQNVALRLDRRLRDLEPMLAGRQAEPAPHAGALAGPAA